MKTCPNCQMSLQEDAAFCFNCGTPLGPLDSQSTVQAGPNSPATNNVTNPSEAIPKESRSYCILAYIGFLFIVGLLCNQKTNKAVRFHVGQGMILFIVEIVLGLATNLINTLIIHNVFSKEITFFGYGTGVREVTATGLFLSSALSIGASVIALFFLVKGIQNVMKGRQEPLPIIGKFAFYK